ncbi:unnamed protein product [Symbiodinium sp. CCMP2592]|nr:unnamed protein product [Symbiodinium sp. CCMP2592]
MPESGESRGTAPAAPIVAKASAAPPMEPPMTGTPETKNRAKLAIVASPADARSPDPKRTKCDGSAGTASDAPYKPKLMSIKSFMAEAVDAHVAAFYFWHRDEGATLMEPPSVGLENMLTWMKCDFPGEAMSDMVLGENRMLIEGVLEAQLSVRNSMNSVFMLDKLAGDEDRLEATANKMKRCLNEYPQDDPVVLRKLQLTDRWLEEAKQNSVLEKQKISEMLRQDQVAASWAVSQLFVFGLFKNGNMAAKLTEMVQLWMEMDAAQLEALRIENTSALQLLATPQKGKLPGPVVEPLAEGNVLTPTEPCDTQKTSVEDTQEEVGAYNPEVPGNAS